MAMTFRGKLMAIVASVMLAFVVLIGSSTLIGSRVDIELVRIEQRYLPRVEAGPKLAAQFDRIGRSFQDAVAAHDADALAETRKEKDALLGVLEASPEAFDPKEVSALRSAVEVYYAAGADVSRRLMAGETGEAIVDAMSDMQAKRARAQQALERATSFDREELAAAFRATQTAQATGRRVQRTVLAASFGFVLLLSLWLSRGALRSLSELASGFTRFGEGSFGVPIAVTARDELAVVAAHANEMAANLAKLEAEREKARWIEGSLVALAKEIRGELTPQQVAERAVRSVARQLDIPCAALFVRAGDDFHLLGRHGFEDHAKSVRLGEGLVGETARGEEIRVVADPPVDYVKVASGLGDGAPRGIILVPLVHSSKVVGVLELATFRPWSERAEELVVAVRETIAVALQVATGHAALQAGEERLRVINEELRTQQEELRQTNDELTLYARELEAARHDLETKARELATVSAYKSQFLANMSHELRTPLNSMLLLSSLLADNAQGNLTPKQVEHAQTIHAAGSDLLSLINQVLDLAKVEAGKQEVRVSDVDLAKIATHVERVHAPLAQRKQLSLDVKIDPGAPKTLVTDEQRLTQILVNLLGNAIKFTDTGGVELRIAPSDGPSKGIAFIVADTGPGIAPRHLQRIFAPFEQIDGAADRKHGGTGLGLSIARELAVLLGGNVTAESELGKGSKFTLLLPRERPETRAREQGDRPAPVTTRTLGDDIDSIGVDEEYLLVIEDDRVVATTLGELIRDQGVRWIAAGDGETGLRIAKQRTPSGIVLDVKLPGVDGWAVMDSLRADPVLSLVPVHFLSAVDEEARGRELGAVGWATKPASREDLSRVVQALMPSSGVAPSKVLVVAHDDGAANSIVGAIVREGVAVQRVTTGEAAVDAIASGAYGCVVIDSALPDIDGIALVDRISSRKATGSSTPGIVVYTSGPIERRDALKLEADAVVVLKEGSSEQRLAEEIRLFVRRIREGVASSRRDAQKHPLPEVHLEGRHVLVADDDMRTVYALSATLRAKGIEVLVADTGRAALELLDQHRSIDAVLMDIMMPEMDGYEATRRIRRDPRFANLPIIALTAKAMKGDRERCIEAGATDYLPKPVDIDRLLVLLDSLIRQRRDHVS